MPVVHLLVMLLPGIATPISTEQVFASLTACEVAKAALTTPTSATEYLCIPAPDKTPNR